VTPTRPGGRARERLRRARRPPDPLPPHPAPAGLRPFRCPGAPGVPRDGGRLQL